MLLDQGMAHVMSQVRVVARHARCMTLQYDTTTPTAACSHHKTVGKILACRYSSDKSASQSDISASQKSYFHGRWSLLSNGFRPSGQHAC